MTLSRPSDQYFDFLEIGDALFHTPIGSLIKIKIWFTRQWVVHQQSASRFMHTMKVHQNTTETPDGNQKAFEFFSCCDFFQYQLIAVAFF